jgi:hypothetical protein
MKVIDLVNRIRRQAAEKETDFWSNQEIVDYIGDAQIMLATRTSGVYQKTYTTDTTASVRAYTTPTDVGSIERVVYSGTRLTGVNLDDLNRLEGDTTVVALGFPNYYYQFAGGINLSPVPDTSASLQVDYNAYPGDLVENDTFLIPEWCVRYIPDYALYRMYMKDQELREQGQYFKGQWESNLANVETEWRKRMYNDNLSIVKDMDYLDV